MPLGTNCVMVHNEHHTMSMLIVFLQVWLILEILAILMILTMLGDTGILGSGWEGSKRRGCLCWWSSSQTNVIFILLNINLSFLSWIQHRWKSRVSLRYDQVTNYLESLIFFWKKLFWGIGRSKSLDFSYYGPSPTIFWGWYFFGTAT